MAEAPGPAGSASHPFPRDTLLVRGPDRKSWLDGLLTCGVADVAPGVAAYGLLLTKQGKIVSDVLLADTGQALLLGVAPGHGAQVHEQLDRYLVMEDAELTAPAEVVTWRLGPRGAAPAADTLASGALTLGTLSAEVAVVRAPATSTTELTAGLGALLAEHGLGVFGVDFGERDNPHEASLDRVAISWTKGCYLGQEVVCMQDMRGKVKRRLVALDAEPGVLETPWAAGSAGPDVVDAADAVVGHVTSLHRAASGSARLLASISSAALESAGQLSVLGRPVRVVEGSGPKLG